MNRPPIRPDRLRFIRRGIVATPNRFLHAGFFVSLSHVERSLYLFLLLAADRNGISFYAYDKICGALEITPDDFLLVRDALLAKDLIAFDGTRYQVLSLPAEPVQLARQGLTSASDFERDDPATINCLIRRSLRDR